MEDEEIPSSEADSDLENLDDVGNDDEYEEQNQETAEEKRMRLAKAYLEEIEREGEISIQQLKDKILCSYNEKMSCGHLISLGRLQTRPKL